MAIRNIKLGGSSDFTTEGLNITDLNDTFDAAAEKIQSLSAFWLNSDLYDVYEDFDSLTTGTFTGNTDFSVSNSSGGGSAAGECLINATSTISSGKMLQLTASDDGGGGPFGASCTVKTLTLDSNKHTIVKYQNPSWNSTENDGFTERPNTIAVGNDTDGWTNIFTANNSVEDPSANNHTYKEQKGILFIVAKGDDEYDCYDTYTKTNITLTNGLQLKFYCGISIDNTYTKYFNIDDILQAKSETS